MSEQVDTREAIGEFFSANWPKQRRMERPQTFSLLELVGEALSAVTDKPMTTNGATQNPRCARPETVENQTHEEKVWATITNAMKQYPNGIRVCVKNEQQIPSEP